MPAGFYHPADSVNFEYIRERYTVEQVLNVFGISVNSSNKAICPFHADVNPSLHVNKDFAYCYACKQSWTAFSAAKELLEKDGKPYTFKQVFQWFLDTDFPAAAARRYTTSKYRGPVPSEIADYWHKCLTDDHYSQLEIERLLTRETIDRHRLGWRPDWEAFSIPFFRPDGEVDIIQFRMTRGKSKYMGMEGHNRGSVMNWDLLETPQDFLIVLFGAFDGILARQDGLPAVSFNGSLPFRKDERERVRDLFAKQKKIYIVPDNTEAEVEPAYVLAEWLDAEVRFFPEDLPEDTDYIDFRRMGFTPADFMKVVLGMDLDDQTFAEDLLLYAKAGDPYNFIPVYMSYNGRGRVVQDVALLLAGAVGDAACRERFMTVLTIDQLYEALSFAKERFYHLKGGW